MLNYIITIAISAFFVPHYLSIFWDPLRENPWDVVGGAIVIVLLVGLNVVGVQEATGLNVFLAIIDFATQLLLVILGFVLIFSPSILVGQRHWGTAPTWSNFFLAIPVAMIAYTGIETVSNLAEEARDPPRDIPRSIRLVAVAVFAIYFTLPLIASQRCRSRRSTASTRRAWGCRPRKEASRTTRCSGAVKNLDLHGFGIHSLEIYVGMLAATILLVATNAGVIGASRITYSMATYRQLPGLSPASSALQDAWLAIVVFAGIASIAVILPGQTFLGTMYSFGAMLSFTIAHAAVVALRIRRRHEELVCRARPTCASAASTGPIRAARRPRHRTAWVVVLVQEPTTRWVGLGWLALGFAVYTVYRRQVVHLPLRQTARLPALVLGLEVEFRTILVPILRTRSPRRRSSPPPASRRRGAYRHPPCARGSTRPRDRRRHA